MRTVDKLKKHLKAGQLYRRADLLPWTNAVDRHLQQLVEEEVLQKLSPGLYYYPKITSFGITPPSDEKLVSAFLKSNDFLMLSPNLYNSLEVGTTQLYNQCFIYNHKRHGVFKLGGKNFDFRLKHKFPKSLSREFLFVDLLNNLNELAEDREVVLINVKEKLLNESESKMKRAIHAYAGERTKNLLIKWESEKVLAHA